MKGKYGAGTGAPDGKAGILENTENGIYGILTFGETDGKGGCVLRCPGFWHTEKEAEEAAEANDADMYEAGYYTYAQVFFLKYGLLQKPVPCGEVLAWDGEKCGFFPCGAGEKEKNAASAAAACASAGIAEEFAQGTAPSAPAACGHGKDTVLSFAEKSGKEKTAYGYEDFGKTVCAGVFGTPEDAEAALSAYAGTAAAEGMPYACIQAAETGMYGMYGSDVPERKYVTGSSGTVPLGGTARCNSFPSVFG